MVSFIGETPTACCLSCNLKGNIPLKRLPPANASILRKKFNDASMVKTEMVYIIRQRRE